MSSFTPPADEVEVSILARAGGSEPVRSAGVELGYFAGFGEKVVSAEQGATCR